MQEILNSIVGALNAVTILILTGGVLIGILLGFLLQTSPKNQVLYCRESEARGDQLKVKKEDALSLETNSPDLRFYKFGKGFVFNVKKGLRKIKKVTMHFAKESTAYTWFLLGSGIEPTKYEKKTFNYRDNEGKIQTKEQDVPTKYKPSLKDLKLEFPTLEDAVKFRLGEEDYKNIPLSRQQKLRENKVLVTVGLESGFVPEGFQPVSETTIWDKANERMADVYSNKIKSGIKSSVIDKIPWIGFGVGVALVAGLLMGWIQLAK